MKKGNDPDIPRLISLPKISDPRGNLSFIQGGDSAGEIPFEIERAYWIYDIPGGERHHGRALRTTTEAIVAMSGCFDVEVDNGRGFRHRFTLRDSHTALLLPPMTWRQLENFSTNATALTVSSRPYDPAEYIREHDKFLSEAL